MAKVAGFVAQDRWIMDGNFGGSQDLRMERADTVIHLDFARWRCLARIFKRWFEYRASDRPDMAPGCRERFDGAFLVWVWNFRQRDRPRLLTRLTRWSAGRTVVTLCSPGDVSRFMASLKPSAPG